MGARASSNSKDTEPRNATRAEHLKGSEGRDSQRRRDARETTRNARVKSQLKVEGLPSHQGAEAAGQSWKSLILNSLLVNTIFWGGARRPNGTPVRGQREGTLTLKYRFRVHSPWSTTLSGRDCHAVASPRPVPRLAPLEIIRHQWWKVSAVCVILSMSASPPTLRKERRHGYDRMQALRRNRYRKFRAVH
jgi:hypothetical protein